MTRLSFSHPGEDAHYCLSASGEDFLDPRRRNISGFVGVLDRDSQIFWQSQSWNCLQGQDFDSSGSFEAKTSQSARVSVHRAGNY
jgi:hypothetical protein